MVRDAAIELITFVANYTSMMREQLENLRKVMNESVDEAMRHIRELDARADAQTGLAHQVLVRREDPNDPSIGRGEDKDFKSATNQELNAADDDKLKEALKQTKISSSVQSAGKELRKNMSEFDTMELKVRSLLIGMIGALSADDVVSQRLDHVASAIEHLKEKLNVLLESFPNQFDGKGVQHFCSQMVEDMRIDFTTIEEREIMDLVFPEYKERVS